MKADSIESAKMSLHILLTLWQQLWHKQDVREEMTYRDFIDLQNTTVVENYEKIVWLPVE